MGRVKLFLLACAVIVMMLGAASACANKIEKSPLATWDPSKSDVFPHASSGEGTLEITSGCVLLIHASQTSTILVWPEPTSWNASSQVIDFVDVHGERLELRDGDKISAGGAGYSLVESPKYRGEYVLPPDPSCEAKTDEVFVLNSIRVHTD